MPAVTRDVAGLTLPSMVRGSKWEWKWFCMAASDPTDLLLLSVCLPQLLPHLLACDLQLLYRLRSVTIPALQDQSCTRGQGNLCAGRIFSRSMTGMLLAGKEARSKCAGAFEGTGS